MAKIDAEKVQQYQNAINEAIKIHTKKATESLPYNKSELVEVVDITERNLGKYIVWNGSTRYYAYSENTTYDIGMKVYVNIPNSDFAAQKTIIGQYIAEGEKSVVWVNPLDAFQPLPDINLLEDIDIGEYEEGEKSLLANWNKGNDFPEDPTVDSDFPWPREQEVLIFKSTGEISTEYQGHTYLGITADFRTRLETFSPLDGDYGLRLEVTYRDEISVLQDAVEKTRIYTLSAKNDMIGNVYNFKTYFTQAALYDISDIENITGMKLYFFQAGDFRKNNNKPIPVYYHLGEGENKRYYLLRDNIFVNNIKINVGDDLITKNDKIKIKTLQGLTYSTTQNNALNYKNIELEWDHLNPDSEKFEILDKTAADEKIVNYKIHWYRDVLFTSSEPVGENPDPEVVLTDETWERFKALAADKQTKEELDKVTNEYKINLISGTDYNYNGDLVVLTASGQKKLEDGVVAAIAAVAKKRQSSSIQVDSLAGKGWQSLGESKNFNYDYFLPDTKKSYSKVMAIIEYNTKSNTFDSLDPNYVIVKSNVLEFTNEAMTSNPLSDDKASALQISCEDGSNGDYPIYSGITGQLLSRTDVSLVRNFKATCKSLYDGSNYLTGDEIIIWQIPKLNTMIVVNDSFIGEEAQLLNKSPHAEIEYDDNYYFIARSASNAITPVSDTQQYQIAQFFNKACVNNTIYCYIIKNNEVFKASKTLTFNQHGTSGTDYTFTLGFKQKVDEDWNVVGPADTALTIGDIDYLEIDFRLFNSKNEEIELTDEQKNAIIDLWTGRVESGYYSGVENARNVLSFITQANADNQDIRVAVRIQPSFSSENEDKLKYIVLQATVSSDVSDNDLGKVQFTQLLPIHIRAAGTNYVLNGSDYIIYDDKGANPSFYNDKYELIGTEVPENLSFEINWNSVMDENEGDDSSFYPLFDGMKLVPTPLYINDIGNEIWIDCYQNLEEEKKLLYTFPLVILQNKYQIPAINQWNGELVVDSSGNKVLAAMVGAGHKNPDNTFSGVLMGDIEKDNEKDTGLFGYDEGAQTFGFNVNGEAFIGASGNGRIYVDGNTGRIVSAAREAYDKNIEDNKVDSDPRGTEINLKDNYIDIQGIGNAAGVHLDTRGNDYPYLSVDDVSGNRLLQVKANDYYLQTSNYSDNNKTGLKIDLSNGTLNSYDKLTINGGLGSEIKFGDDNNYITLGLNNTGSYFNMYKKAGDPTTAADNLDNAWEVLTTVWNDLEEAHADNLVPERNTNYRTTEDEYGEITNENDVNNRILDLDILVSDLNDNKNSAENELNNALDDLRDAQSALDIATFNYESAVAEYNEALEIYNISLDDLRNARDEAETVYNAAVAVREAAEETYYSILSEKSEKENTIAILNSQIDQLDSRISEIEGLLTADDSELTPQQRESLEAELRDLQSQQLGLQSDQENAQNELTAIEIRFNTAKTDLENAQFDEENAANALLIAIDALQNQEFYKAQALDTLVEIGPTFLPSGSQCYNFDGTQYSLLVDGELLTIKNEKNDIVNNEINGKQKIYNDKLQAYNDAVTAYDTAILKLNNIKTALENYLSLYNTYINNVNSAGDGFININNTENKRLEVGSAFSVSKNGTLTASNANIQGTIKADSGYLNNVTVKTLNFNGEWIDDKGVTHTNVTGITPKWMTFVTDITASFKTGKVGVTATVSDTISVPYSYNYQTVTTADQWATFHTINRATMSSSSSNKITYSTWNEGSLGDNPDWWLRVDVPDVKIGTTTVTKTATKDYKATVTGTTNVPVIKSMTLTVTKVSMWALTNNTTKTSEKTISSGL